MSGFKDGFSLSNQKFTPTQPPKNLKSAFQHPEIVDNKIKKECALGRIAGPFISPPLDNMVFSPLGLQPKKLQGEFRVIHHLSYPKGESINDGIPRHLATVKYSSVGQAIKNIITIGNSCYMAKTDIKSAFRIVPVAPSDYHLLGFYWGDKYYFDRCLPMGCSSSCAIFEAFSTSLEWIIQTRLPQVAVLHILDDFLFISPTYHLGKVALQTFISICEDIGVPLAPEKTVGPSQVIEFAGIHLDSVDMSASLPQDKVTKFIHQIDQTLDMKTAQLKHIQALAGMLNFACAIIAPARAFSRRLIDMTIGLSKPYHHRKVTSQVRQDLLLWKRFLKGHNRKTFFLDFQFLSQQTLQFYTDSSSTVGFGGFFGNRWFAGKWPQGSHKYNIALLELYPICLAIKLWGPSLSNKCITINSDNMAVVHVLNSSTSKDPLLMTLLRVLVLDCMNFNLFIQSQHISGHFNILADMLSRDKVVQATKMYPHLDRNPEVIPQAWQLERFLEPLQTC